MAFFTNVLSGMRRMTSCKKPKQPSPAKFQTDASYAGAVSPSVIGNSALSSAHPPHLLGEEDDARWPQVEDLEAGCRSADHCIINVAKIQTETGTREAAKAQLIEIDEGASLSTVPTENSNGALSEESSENESKVSEDEEGEPSDDEGEFIPGTLDVPPAVGEHVKALMDDDDWHLAKVLKVSGSKARLCFEDGKQDVLDFEVHAVRLADYASDVSDSEEEGEQQQQEVDEAAKESPLRAAAHFSADVVTAPTGVAALAPAPRQEEGPDSDSQWEEEEEQIPGTLDEAPPVGSMVKVLADDDMWHPARVSSVEGTVANLTFEDGEVQVIDFDEHAVRLYDYVSDGEDDDDKVEGEDERSKDEDVKEVVLTCPKLDESDQQEIAEQPKFFNADLLGIDETSQENRGEEKACEQEEPKCEEQIFEECSRGEGSCNESPTAAPDAAVIGRSIEHAD
jgi:hypothetical protein